MEGLLSTGPNPSSIIPLKLYRVPSSKSPKKTDVVILLLDL